MRIGVTFMHILLFRLWHLCICVRCCVILTKELPFARYSVVKEPLADSQISGMN